MQYNYKVALHHFQLSIEHVSKYAIKTILMNFQYMALNAPSKWHRDKSPVNKLIWYFLQFIQTANNEWFFISIKTNIFQICLTLSFAFPVNFRRTKRNHDTLAEFRPVRLYFIFVPHTELREKQFICVLTFQYYS